MDQRRLDRLLTSLHRTDTSASVLHRICLVCVDATSMCGAGVSRMIDGHHEVLDASDPGAAEVERLQVTLGEGPSLETVASFRPWLEPDLASSRALERWPQFARAALDRGVAATFAFPLLTGGVAVGALDVYASEPRDFASGEFEDALILAGLAALAVERLDPLTSIAGVDLAAEPAEGWAHAAIVHNATGMVSEQLDIDVDEAMLRLRAVAFATGRSVADVARDIVDRVLRIDSWADHG